VFRDVQVKLSFQELWFQNNPHLKIISVQRRGALGCTRNRKTEEKIVQNHKTTKTFAQNQKPHTKRQSRYSNDKWSIILSKYL